MAPPGGIDTGRRGLERFDAPYDPTHARIRLAKRARRRGAAEERAVPEGTARPSRDHPRSNVHCMSWFDGLGVRLRRRWTQAHDGLPPRRAVRESPNFAHGAQLGGSDASPPHRTWPSRSPCRRSSIRDPGRSSPRPRCTDSGVMCVIAPIESGSTAVLLSFLTGPRGRKAVRRSRLGEVGPADMCVQRPGLGSGDCAPTRDP